MTFEEARRILDAVTIEELIEENEVTPESVLIFLIENQILEVPEWLDD